MNVIWEGEHYRVAVKVSPDMARFMVQDYRPRTERWHTVDVGDWHESSFLYGFRTPARKKWWQRRAEMSIPEAGQKAIDRARRIEAAWQESQRQIAETKQEVAAFEEVRAIVEAI